MTKVNSDKTLTELSEKVLRVSDLYASRFDVTRDEVWYLAKLGEELGELTAAYLSQTGRGRDRGLCAEELRLALEGEVADLFAHLLLFAQYFDVDIVAALQRKWFSHLQ